MRLQVQGFRIQKQDSRRCRQRHFAALLILIVAAAHGQPTAGQSAISGETLLRWVQGIEGRSPEGRREYVKNELLAMELTYDARSFSHAPVSGEPISGENIIVSLGKGTRNVVVGAHYDAVPGSPGANDNGGGVAVVLGLLKSMKDFPWKYRVDFCFFDQEEVGLIGSREFVKRYADSSIHLAMINLDVEGTGDALYVGPVGGGDDDVLMPIVRKAAQGSLFFESEHYPSSDHLSFAAGGLENISISVVPKTDVPLLIEAVKNDWQIEEGKVPSILTIMHTSRDSAAFVSPKSLALSFAAVRSVLVHLNEAHGR